jgi:phospholipid transport system substrate-binding protein
MRTVLTLIAAVSIAAPLAAAAPSGPMAALKQKNGEFDKLLREKPAAGSPAEKKQKEDIKALAATMLDYAELSKRSMADKWVTLTAAQRDQFVANFRDLLEHKYVKQIRTNIDYAMQYKNEEVTGDDATVLTIVKVKTKGKSTDAEIVYKVHKVGAAWLVWDIVTDDISMVSNYKSQFIKILNEKGYDELIKKIKANIDKLENGA